MPLYDNIADAFELIPGAQYTVTLNCSGATNETNENAVLSMTAGIWLKLDLSAPGYQNLINWSGNDNQGRTLDQVHVTVSLNRLSGTFIPYIDCLYASDASFDVNSPDFSKMDYGPFWFGDGTTTWGPTDKAGRPDEGISPPLAIPGIFWLKILDWNWAIDADGSVELTYEITPADIVATDVVNPDSTTASIVSGWVRDSQAIYTSAATDGAGWYWGADLDKPDLVDTLKIPNADLPSTGVYDCFLQYRNSVAVANDNVPFGVFRDELMLGSNIALVMVGSTSTQQIEVANTKDDGRMGNPSGIPIRGGDNIGFRMALYNDSDTSVAELGRIALRAQTFTVPGSNPVLMIGQELPLGVTIEPTNDATHEATFIARGGEVESIDLCELNGDLYLFWTETDGSRLLGTLHILGPAISKWNGTTWTLLTNNLWGHGSDITWLSSAVSRSHGSVACCSDGLYAYFVWAESDGTQTGSRRNWHWRCKRYDPNTNTFTELGTGPSSGQGNRRFDPAGSIAAQVGSSDPYATGTGTSEEYGTGGFGIHMEANNGRIWVAMSEPDTNRSGISEFHGRPAVWYWDTNAGSPSWVEAHPNDPSESPSGATFYFIDPVWVERQKHVGLAFCHANGPNEWPSCFFHASYEGTPTPPDDTYLVYQEFNGTSWVNELIIHNISEITGTEHPDWQLSAEDFPWTHLYTTRSMTAFTWDDSPGLIAAYDSLVNYPMIQLRVDADGNGMTQVTLPSDFMPAENFGSCAHALVVNGILYLSTCDLSNFAGSTSYVLMKQAEIGTGDKWHYISKSFSKHMYEGYTPQRIATDGSKIWMAATDNFDLRVWGWTPQGGPIVFNKIVAIR